MVELFDIVPYSIERLVDLLTNASGAEHHAVLCSSVRDYFEEYFGALSAQTILREQDYLDADFQKDYSGYYSFCFSDVKKTCIRLHFFNQELNNELFNGLLSGHSLVKQDELAASYLGYIVIKPIAERFIGRTCLKTYDKSTRFFL